MLPTFQIFNYTIAMYGLMILVGVLSGITVASLRSNKYRIKREDIIYASCYAGIGLIIGAKLLYIITILPEIIEYRQQFFSNLSLFIPIITSGFVFYGGLIGAVIGYYLYCKQYHINMIELLDLMTPSIPLIHGFGRLGCFFAGCCYGIHYDGPLHIIFHNSPVAPNEIPLLPVQLIESGLNFLASITLLFYAIKDRKPGKTLGIYLIYYAVMRFVLEFFRGDIARGLIFGISTSQWISILLIPIGIWFFTGTKLFKLPMTK